MKRWTAAVAAALALFSLGADARAQTRYSPWTDPAGASSPGAADRAALIDELRKLVDQADKDRAANPIFLRDLRALMDRHGGAVPSVAALERLRDDFADGNFTHNPAWSVESGQFWIEKGYGLRSTVAAAASNGAANGTPSRDDVAAAVIGSILNRALGGKDQGGTAAAPAPASASSARIHTVAAFANAFSMSAEFTSWKKEGAFVIGPYQGARSGGYRLVYRPGQTPSLELLRVSVRGATVIASYDRQLDLEDRRVHALQWDRSTDGVMTVRLDNAEVIRVADRTLRDGFAGVAVENRGGDYVLAKIMVSSR